ncbi:MAG: D-glycero-beta-D-manno-heptose 1,7-bisphosphate 7-phosphatase [Chromatiales bacterium]
MRILILDRDGVINQESDSFIKSPDEWIPIPRSLEAIARANAAGYRVVVLSNQSAIARGIIDVRTLHLINQKMIQRLAEVGGRIEAIFFCPHAAVQNCLCRKPRPGLFTDLAARLHVSLKNAPAVGDRLRDLEAARAAGARPILVKTGRGQATLASGQALGEIDVYADLAAAVDALPEIGLESERDGARRPR